MKTEMTKKELRKHYLSIRNQIPPEERKAASGIICEKLLPYIKGKIVLSYYPIASEADLNEINDLFLVAYPVIREGNQMDAYLGDGEHFQFNRYGIREPDPRYAKKIAREDIDLILVPCLAFNPERYRLGYGGGYYDRYLKDCHALKIGIAYSLQECREDFREEHDIPLDLIITEKSTR